MEGAFEQFLPGVMGFKHDFQVESSTSGKAFMLGPWDVPYIYNHVWGMGYSMSWGAFLWEDPDQDFWSVAFFRAKPFSDQWSIEVTLDKDSSDHWSEWSANGSSDQWSGAFLWVKDPKLITVCSGFGLELHTLHIWDALTWIFPRSSAFLLR